MPGEISIKRLIVLMAKQPAPGWTKTRLTPFISHEEAAELYRCFLVDKLAQLEQVSDVERAVAYSPAEANDYFLDLAPGFLLIEQTGENLSRRLSNMFQGAFAQGYDQVMAVDGDTVTLPPEYFLQGFQALDNPSTDVILGPTEDGGYYAIGMKDLHPTLFDVKMSTPDVTKDTLAQASKAQLNVTLLPEWYDVDRPEDLHRLHIDLANNKQTATAVFLNKLMEGAV